MRTIREYILEQFNIKEAVDVYRLNSVKATYFVQPEEIILQAPEHFQESDIQTYMNDMWFNSLPSSSDYSEQFFGKNNDNISDVYFEYDNFQHIDVEPKEYIEFDPKFDVKKTPKDTKLEYFKITNLKYIIAFDRFDMVDVTDDTVKEKLVEIFKAAESNDSNDQYPIEIKFDEDSLEYRK